MVHGFFIAHTASIYLGKEKILLILPLDFVLSIYTQVARDYKKISIFWGPWRFKSNLLLEKRSTQFTHENFQGVSSPYHAAPHFGWGMGLIPILANFAHSKSLSKLLQFQHFEPFFPPLRILYHKYEVKIRTYDPKEEGRDPLAIEFYSDR